MEDQGSNSWDTASEKFLSYRKTESLNNLAAERQESTSVGKKRKAEMEAGDKQPEEIKHYFYLDLAGESLSTAGQNKGYQKT